MGQLRSAFRIPGTSDGGQNKTQTNPFMSTHLFATRCEEKSQNKHKCVIAITIIHLRRFAACFRGRMDGVSGFSIPDWLRASAARSPDAQMVGVRLGRSTWERPRGQHEKRQLCRPTTSRGVDGCSIGPGCSRPGFSGLPVLGASSGPE